ncbi:catechol O-methyltransferase [Pseudovirgaria hyperparasitica]|uniref:catechol O-methyltransferase n=1 Tax=Pseudovirgaria hyperparasitica TaxID=470096 RepID=A0A6A6WHU3_9PEZI|nr:catechol O-methyltransferase [Pseudovirgaria hyperparasitica]KAF2760721.1 catechol O-methyltransferase [Pseudovirgaria hyperparasitica]
MGRPEFDRKTAYIKKGEVWFDDGREEALVSYIKSHPHADSFQNKPHIILSVIDEFARTKDFMMTVGQYKGAVVTDLIAKERPQTIVEMGGYTGYSALLFGSALRDAWNGVEGAKPRYYSLEMSEKFAGIIRELVKLAGLDHVVTVVTGKAEDGLRELREDFKLETADMFFIDHYKPAYVGDLQRAEDLGLVRKGTWVVADNVVLPGAPGYLEYVRGTAKGEGIRKHVYESRLEESWEPTGEEDGLEVSKCIEVR